MFPVLLHTGRACLIAEELRMEYNAMQSSVGIPTSGFMMDGRTFTKQLKMGLIGLASNKHSHRPLWNCNYKHWSFFPLDVHWFQCNQGSVMLPLVNCCVVLRAHLEFSYWFQVWSKPVTGLGQTQTWHWWAREWVSLISLLTAPSITLLLIESGLIGQIGLAIPNTNRMYVGNFPHWQAVGSVASVLEQPSQRQGKICSACC